MLIPTRNRAKELSSLLAIIEKYRITDVEFIVSDNSDVDLKLKDIPSVKYIRPNRVMNMTDHWNWLLTHAQGKFITYLGDDDAFIPSELSKLIQYASNCTSDIIWTTHSGYGWPLEGNDGNFFLNYEKKPKPISIEKIRAKILKLNHKTDLPIPYCRVIFSRNIIDSFWRANPGSNFCSSRSPDISAGVKLAFLSNSQCNFDRVVFISGASKSSNGRLTQTDEDLSGDFQFNNLMFNPVYPGVLEGLTVAPPFGYIVWFEAFESSISQLSLTTKCPRWKVAFRSVFYSKSIKQQFKISSAIWGLFPVIIVAFIAHIVYFALMNRYFSKIMDLLSMYITAVINRRSVIIIRGRELKNTFSLVDYLEASKVLQLKKRIIKIHLK